MALDSRKPEKNFHSRISEVCESWIYFCYSSAVSHDKQKVATVTDFENINVQSFECSYSM